MNTLRIIGKIATLILGIFRSLWNATIHIVWGIATIFLLGGLMGYFSIDATSITTLLELVKLLMNNWVAFWWVFFALELFQEIDKLEIGVKND